jgi:hypothetical protein
MFQQKKKDMSTGKPKKNMEKIERRVRKKLVNIVRS